MKGIVFVTVNNYICGNSVKGNFMTDNQAQKSTSASQPASGSQPSGSYANKKPEAAKVETKNSSATDNKADGSCSTKAKS